MQNGRDESENEILGQRHPMSMVSVPSNSRRLARRVQSFLSDLEAEHTWDDIGYLKSCFSQPECPQIDYDRFGASFAYWYLLENFWKAVSCFLQDRPPLARRIVDAGCGSGAVTIAYLAALDQALDDCRWIVDVTLIDRSERQLDLARKILLRVGAELRNLSIVPHYECIDLEDWKPQGQRVDAILFGHVLNENRPNLQQFLETAVSAVSNNGRIYIIERVDDAIWPAVRNWVPHLALPTSCGIAKLPTHALDSDCSPRITRRSCLTTSYLTLRFPEHNYIADLVRSYFHAWQTQSVELLDKVFMPYAEYHEKPHEAPLRGLEQIRAYWREKVLTQRDISVAIRRVSYAGKEAFAEWEAEFSRAGDRVNLSGVVILKAGPEGERVTALHEYFRSHKMQDRARHG